MPFNNHKPSYKSDNRRHHETTPAPELILDYVQNPELFNETASKWAQFVSRTKSTQIRKFYDYLLDLQVKSQTASFGEILPFVKMLNSKAAYSQTRGHASYEFVQMVNACVKQVNTKEQLDTFKLFFEAVIGFSKK
ncbi:MAG: type III-A CRISPR-associated protein Csm2 [Sulfuricurvum sp.]|nr:type III-A CRISPR-associated protein Csm2 [Sulfuricurvum sp.]